MSFALSGERITVGRDDDNGIQIAHPTVSGHHAELIALNGHYVMRDLQSTNHCLLEGEIVVEAELNRPCRIELGSVECQYIPDEVDSTPEQLDTLRKAVGLLRRQNDELIAKVSEQQRQIKILGHAKLFTAAEGADMASLREQVKSQSAERELLAAENQALRKEIEELCAIVASSSDSQTLKEALAVRRKGLPGIAPGALASMSDGKPDAAAPCSTPVAESGITGYERISELNRTLQSLVGRLIWEPAHQEATSDLVLVASQMAEVSQSLGHNPVARIAGDLYPLVHEASLRPGPINRGILQTLSHTSDFLAEVLKNDSLSKLNGFRSPRIVAVDDDPDLLSTIVSALEFASLPTIGCANARDALSTLQETRCDLILLDIGLPDLNGIDMCSCIRALPKHDHTPIVFLTGNDTAENRSRGLLQGACDFIGKPFNMIELTLRVNTWALKNQLAAA
jgi:CheY-like chemotaxis protein